MFVSRRRSGRAFVRVRSLGVGSPPINRFDPIYIDRLWLAEFGGSLGVWLLSLHLVQHFSLRLI